MHFRMKFGSKYFDSVSNINSSKEKAKTTLQQNR